MEEFVVYIIKNIVSKPDAVEVSSLYEEGSLRICVRVAKEDLGKVIGRSGKTIRSLRTITRTVGVRVGHKVQVELLPCESPEDVVDDEVLSEDNKEIFECGVSCGEAEVSPS